MRDLLASPQHLLEYVLDGMVEGLFLLDKDLAIQYMNESAMQIVDGVSRDDDYLGQYFYDYVKVEPIGSEDGRTPYLLECLETGKSVTGVIREYPNGKVVSINVVPIIVEGEDRGLMITMEDITKIVDIEKELDMAFALTLPNSKVEYKMKNTVEYRDEYHPETHQIEITGIIHDGGYRHVVNSLKILSSFAAQGVTKVIGIDKDELVRAIIFHDLGKAQVDLHTGAVVDPKEVFEDGKLHAFRSAELAKHYYHQSDDVIEIIRYHHHGEHELPESFPWRLLPMFRLFQLIDGISAAITRGDVEVSFAVKDSTIYVTERNSRPEYNGSWQCNLYSGERSRVALLNVPQGIVHRSL
ncbi:HD domain-containing protein [Alicyclobacillus sp. SO9]|uniref:HD domain-containing protein n=1 Tax=Alicyclobacillus sp. SO9 TaxID=2665646 RepID=UPI0018E795D4|nr:HD domain-containing protein [Alicyclobacillus sp. SO9]QQE78307.1 PAS domain-containing protein [Alicyclobacillus sp. SO9]